MDLEETQKEPYTSDCKWTRKKDRLTKSETIREGHSIMCRTEAENEREQIKKKNQEIQNTALK